MGDCEATLRELRAYLDRECTDAARSEVEEHIGGCTDCLQAFDFQAELRLVIARKCSDELPPTLLARIRECIGDTQATDGSAG